MKAFILLAILLCIIGIGTDASAGSGIIKIDDVRCRGWEGPYSFIAGGNLRFLIRFTNDTGERVNITNTFVVNFYHAAWFDSISIDTTVNVAWHSPFAAYFDQHFALNKEVWGTPWVLAVAGGGTPGMGLPPGFDDTVLAITVWNVRGEGTVGQYVCIDSANFQPILGQWRWSTVSGPEYSPVFKGLDASQPYMPDYGYCFLALPPCMPPAPAKAVEVQASCGCNRCCQGSTGDVNMSGGIDLSDMALLISYMVQTPRPVLPCPEEANANGRADIDLSDLSRLIAYLTATPRPVLPACP